MIDRTWGERGPTAIFVPGNGFSAAAYRQLLEPLAQHYVIHGLKLRPLWENAVPTRHWHELARDIGAFVDQEFSAPIVGLGHSIGAVTILLAAAERPARFSQIVLLDPVTLPKWAAVLLRLAPAFVRRRGPFAMRTLRRKDRWTSREEALASERARRSLVRVPDSVLQDLVDSGVVEHPQGGYTLRYSKEWESRLYESPPNLWRVMRRRLPPVALVRGAASDVLSKTAFQRWQARCPHHRAIEVPDTGHLVPFEKPAEVAALVRMEIERERAMGNVD